MPNGIQKYIANKTCSIATNVKKTDDKIKYGSEDMICCINKDFMANVFSELLMCNAVATDNTWYKLSLCLELEDRSPPEYTYGTDLIISTIGYITSYDGNKQAFADITGIYNFANILEANTVLAVAVNDAGKEITDPTIFFTAAYNATDECVDITIYHDSSWGNTTEVLSYGTLVSTLPLTATLVSSTHVVDSTVVTGTCLTAAQLCSIKSWLDEYTQSC